MAGAAQPGPTCGHSNPVAIDDGTSCRAPSPQPGIATRAWEKVAGWGDSIASKYDHAKASLQSTYQWAKGSARLDYEGGRCIYQAYLRANDLAFDAIVEETGYQLRTLLAGLLPGLVQMLVIVGATTFLGAAIGGIVGFFFAGAGAAPGAVVGGELGLDAGVAILSWLGLAFLAVEIGKGMGEMLVALKNGILWAWGARRLSGSAEENEVDRAGQELARSVGILMRLILQAILAYILKKAASGATRSAATTETAVRTQGAAAVSETIIADLVRNIRKSWFGDGLADWVEKNWRGLKDNPKGNNTPPPQAPPPAQAPPPEPASPKASASYNKTQSKFQNTLDTVDKTGQPPAGYKGGRQFANDGRGGGAQLPSTDANGNPIQYREWDVNPKQPGVNRGSERLVTGSDGSAYSTSDHYMTFEKIR